MKKYLRRAADYVKTRKNRYPITERLMRGVFLSYSRPRLGMPTAADDNLAAELRAAMNRLPKEEPNRASPAENKWIRFKNAIRQHATEEDPRDFLDWPEVRFNMQYVPSRADLRYLKSDPAWRDIENALREKPSIRRKPYFALPAANENAIKQAYHFTNFLNETGTKLADIGRVIEFGGGYGSMCLYVHNLGFRGTYIIFDWPELSALQQYYLKSQSLSRSIGFGASAQTNIKLVSEIKEIAAITREPAKTLLIATWSLSECSPELRDAFIAAAKPDYVLISYQKAFAGIDNETYFSKLKEKMPDYEWKTVPMAFIPTEKNKYLFGARI